MATQVQQKVTGKSIQIELISPLAAPFSFHKSYKACLGSESHFNSCQADAALIPTNAVMSVLLR